MLKVRRSGERGYFDHGWLQTHHTFSFGDYHHPDYMGFRTLRVMNEDRVQPNQGFATHSHQNMEIVTYILSGSLEHKDNMGNTSIISQGELQRMTAGTGVRHSEFNPSSSVPVHLLQIWILPNQEGLKPSYEQKIFKPSGKKNQLRLVASAEGKEGSIKIHQDIKLYDCALEPNQEVSVDVPEGRGIWIQMLKGTLNVGHDEFVEGDGVQVEDEHELRLKSTTGAELLVFELT